MPKIFFMNSNNNSQKPDPVDKVVFYENGSYYCIVEYKLLRFILGIGKTEEAALYDAASQEHELLEVSNEFDLREFQWLDQQEI